MFIISCLVRVCLILSDCLTVSSFSDVPKRMIQCLFMISVGISDGLNDDGSSSSVPRRTIRYPDTY
ncbi:hypothetical protein [Hornefia butyriciproducens]|uniref:hypothetical protein n=1 Tax=Hornefia butyriciproducens TaxID=2652293 RepID=UPI003F88E887